MNRRCIILLGALLLAACGGEEAPPITGGPPVVETVAVEISPTDARVGVSGTQQFTCAVIGVTPNTNCTWSVQEGAAGGTVSATGLYTAPATAGTYRVVATSAAFPGRSATATVLVTAGQSPASAPWVTGYYAGWFWDQMYPPQEVDMSAMTHFVFGRAAPGGGSLGGLPGQVVEGAGTAIAPACRPMERAASRIIW